MAAFAGVVSKHSPIALIGNCSGNKISIPRPVCVVTVEGERQLRLPPMRAVNVGGFEPDISEEPIDYYRTPGVSEEDFPYGYADGAHTWHEGDDGDFKEEFLKVFKESGGPSGFQGAISWLFLPGLVGGMVLNVPGDYLYIYTTLFVFAFIGIEMAKPDHPFNFEPKIYNMERKARDKFMEDYNSMSIWEFNEKYKDE
ncbi:hypothetical protein SUGI_0167290 [Cryptomeria japonica]|uniref:photosynthetic NDH subunit of subcomplex B 5, chloroplastic n=1 Tax=Cryptomeria japonica TaxID=3369 RepID=UPI0024089AB4|nr:photosynthetic NDH subunit of subcomplex B 5, chloroplastic [Cryptomeria japonica]GLJ11430.1 hypothetical protein SUGI_0167290 [Cryptomeria japonica]